MILRTIKDTYIALLIECNKQESPTILVEDFNYLYNKAKQNYINRRIGISPIGQQVIDDLAEITVMGYPINSVTYNSNTYPSEYTANLPMDYLHILRCNPEISVNALNSEVCPTPINNKYFPITKPITSKELAEIPTNYYLKPSAKQVYYAVNSNDLQYKLHLYAGTDTTKPITSVFIDYFRVPKTITLTEDDIHETIDNSMLLEFKPYINQEILNELTSLFMDNSSDPRLVQNKQLNQTISPPLIQAAQK